MRTPRLLALIIAAHFALGLLYLWATPMFEASDEGSHYGVVQWLVRGRGLPVQDVTNPKAVTIYHQEGSQPPLYYLLAAGLTFWLPTSDFEQVFVQNPLSEVGYVGATHNVNLYRPAPPEAGGETARAVTLLRLFSLLLSCVTVGLTFALARRVVASDVVALLAAAVVAFNPMALFINASVNNDNLLMLLSTATLLLTLHISRSARPLAGWTYAALGVLLGLAALTKLSGLVLWPVAALGVVGRDATLMTHDERQTQVWIRLAFVMRHLSLVLTIALALCGWWFVRNAQLYGDPFGLNAMVAVAGPRQVDLWTLLTQEWYGFYLSYWGIFGAFTVLPGEWARWSFHLLTLWAIAGGALLLWRRRARGSFESLLLIVFCGLTFLGVIRWTMQTPASQGRLLFGTIAPLSLGMAAAWLAPFGEKASRVVAASLGIALAAIAALIPVVDIAPRYRPPAPLSQAALPSDLRLVHAQFGEGVELVGYRAEAALHHPGDVLRVTLYWRALERTPHDDALALVLFGRANQGVGQIDTWPGAGLLPTSQWTPGAIYADTYALPIATDATAPSLLRLRVGMWRDQVDQRLPIRTPDGAQVEAVTLEVGRLAPALAASFTPRVLEGSTFEHGLTLLGYEANADGALALTFYWRTEQAVPADYTLFVHVITASGLPVTQADGPPLAGDWPTSAWVPGQPFAETRLIALPPDLPPGCCSVRLGWYDPATGVRLAAFRADGERWPEDAVLLNDVVK